jgi:hypothetical protein
VTVDSALSAATRASRAAALMTALGGLFIVGAIVYSALRVQAAEVRVGTLNRQADSLGSLIAARESILVRITPIAAKGLGYVNPDTITSPSSLRSSLSASHAVDSLRRTGTERRRLITVRYYPRAFEDAVNANILLPELRAAGFRLDERPTNPGMSDLGTNAIWFGADVAPDDVKLVALLLMSAGVQLRSIRPFGDPTGPKHAAIEIGADREAVTAPSWTVGRVLATASFRR